MSLGSETRTRPQNPTYVKGVVAEAETSAKRSKLKKQALWRDVTFFRETMEICQHKKLKYKKGQIECLV